MSTSGGASGLVKSSHKPGEFTPVEVIERVRRPQSPATRGFVDEVRRLVRRVGMINTELNLEFYRRGVRNQKNYEGDSYGYFHPLTNEWRSRPIRRQDPFYPHNKVRYYSDAVTADSIQSVFDIQVRPTRDDERAIMGAKAGKRIVDYYEDKLLTTEFLLDEDKQRQFFGQVFFYSDWDAEDGPMIEQPIFEQRSEPAQESYTCLRCGYSGTPDELAAISQSNPTSQPACSQCNGAELMYEEGEPFDYFEITGNKQVRGGDVRTEIVPFLQVDYDRSAMWFEKGSWVIRRRRISIDLIEKDFSWWSGEGMSGADNGTAHDRAGMDILEESVGNTGRSSLRHGRTSDERRVLVEQAWLMPELYHRYKVPADVELAGGDVIPKNTPLIEYYPHGFYVTIAGNEPIDFCRENFRKRWLKLKYLHIPNRADADGIEDIIRPQQEYNDTRSMIVGQVKANAAPPQWVRDPIKEGDFRGQPGYIGHVKGLPYTIPMSNLHHVARIPPLDQHTILLNQQADREMQGALKAFSTSTGAPDIADMGGADTARGMELITSQANKMRGPELALRAMAYAKLAGQWLEIFRENAVDERYIPFKSKTGDTDGAYFKGADLEGDYKTTIRKGSWVPKDEARKRADVLWALEAGAANPQLPREWRQAILDLAGLDMELDEFMLDIRAAQQIVEQIIQLAPMASQMMEGMPPPEPQIDPATGAVMPPPSPVQVAAGILLQMVPMDELDMESAEFPIRISWLRDWAKRDEGVKADPVARMAVALLIRQYKQAMAASMAQDQALAIQANAPQLGMQQQQEQQQADREDKMKAEDRDHQLVADDKRMAHERDIESIRAQRRSAAR